MLVLPTTLFQSRTSSGGLNVPGQPRQRRPVYGSLKKPRPDWMIRSINADRTRKANPTRGPSIAVRSKS